ncbi:MAG: 4-hydroxy-3-methylbut-2-enyl diphosphate reductase [Candidatus Cloacimonas sp.]|nr:4-hydroxy-3-methylbut-2-enyl diphosphate reductase [Candidatus Cloacimonadota bacterium]
MKKTVRLAKNAGFCFGVKRAINLAEEASSDHPEIVTLGPIIHNPQMVEHLRRKGISPVEEDDLPTDKPVIIRSHGITKELRKRLEETSPSVIDATCPYVDNCMQHAKQLSKEGYPVIIYGNKDHPEVIALKSYIAGESYILSDEDRLPDKRFSKLAVISQTTKSIEGFQKLIGKLIPSVKELRVFNTICAATSVRQSSSYNLAKESDLMIVIGGKNSSNTQMLFNICNNIVETLHIEEAEELDCKILEEKSNIGLTAGASTPDWIIVEVYNKIMKCFRDEEKLISKIKDIPGYKEE